MLSVMVYILIENIYIKSKSTIITLEFVFYFIITYNYIPKKNPLKMYINHYFLLLIIIIGTYLQVFFFDLKKIKYYFWFHDFQKNFSFNTGTFNFSSNKP